MTDEGVNMTQKMYERSKVLEKLSGRRITQQQAAIELDISIRQIQRLLQEYQARGIQALASKKQGRPSNHRFSEDQVSQIVAIVSMERYIGFGPTLMCEKLGQLHKIFISRETTRHIMIEAGAWTRKAAKRPVIHQRRPRRARRGELAQIDGSPHDWFEGRDNPCTLIVFIDDATGHTYGKFFPSETTLAYKLVLKEYLQRYGKPVALYADRNSIFRVNKQGEDFKQGVTQFKRIVKILGIELIYAHSPQAKGRVERVNQTLQDRLIKEMRLANICNIEDANRFLDGFWEQFNNQFALAPQCPEDAHRKLLQSEDLDRILANEKTRKVNKNLEFQYENEIYQICVEKPSRELQRASITVVIGLDEKVHFEYQGKALKVTKFKEQKAVEQELDIDHLLQSFSARKSHAVAQNHPWKQAAHAAARMHAYEVAKED